MKITITELTNAGLVFMGLFFLVMAKVMIIDSIRFSGMLHKEFTDGIQRWYVANVFNKKLYLNVIYNISNPDFARLKEGEFYKQLIPDGSGKFYIPQWSIFAVENGYLPNRALDDKYLNSRSLLQAIFQ